MTARTRRSPVLAAALRPRVPSEEAEQSALVQWCFYGSNRVRELGLLVAVPNGGHRHKAVAAKLRAQGVQPGYPDLLLDVARGEYHGLRIEMKRIDAPPSAVKDAQRGWHRVLAEQGYRVEVCRGAREAAAALLDYLGATGRVPLPN